MDYKECIVNDKFLVANTEDKNTILIGRNILNKISKINQELKDIISRHPNTFDGKPNQEYKSLMCKTDTPPGKKVNIKYRSIPKLY